MDTKDKSDSHRVRLDELREGYLETLPERLEKLEYFIANIPVDSNYREDGGNLRAGLNLAYQEAHKLAGSAGAFGLRLISQAAAQVQDVIDKWFDPPPKDPRLKQQEMLRLVRAMSSMDTDEKPGHSPQAQHSSSTIHIVDDDELVAEEMRLWLEEAGFDAQVFLSASVYGDTYEILPRPDLIIMDIVFGNERSAGTRIIQFLKQKFGLLPPVAFLSVRDDIGARLSAFRSGAARYLAKPVSRTDLVELAREFADRKGTPAFRVLMVDDDETVLKVNQLIMEQAGLKVRSVSNPLETLDAAREFEPDVIILDVLMPEASGSEIAAVLREDRHYDPVPILFLTSATHPDQKVIGAALGGDDFINKPFDPDYLIATVFARARRSRRLRELLRQSQEN
ncbi:response regulator [Marinobacter salinus]|nr:response regulator [Marinobacter salinus]